MQSCHLDNHICKIRFHPTQTKTDFPQSAFDGYKHHIDTDNLQDSLYGSSVVVCAQSSSLLLEGLASGKHVVTFVNRESTELLAVDPSDFNNLFVCYNAAQFNEALMVCLNSAPNSVDFSKFDLNLDSSFNFDQLL